MAAHGYLWLQARRERLDDVKAIADPTSHTCQGHDAIQSIDDVVHEPVPVANVVEERVAHVVA